MNLSREMRHDHAFWAEFLRRACAFSFPPKKPPKPPRVKLDPRVVKLRDRLKKYGLTQEAHSRILESQDGKCAICRRPPVGRSLAVDHCHRTGIVRGLLCSRCNMGIGLFADDPGLFRTCIDYLEAVRPSATADTSDNPTAPL